MTTFLTEEQRAANEKLASRIAALIAKAERTDNEDEAAVFMAKAEELMLKHMIDRADLEARGKAQKEPITSESMVYPHAKCYFTPLVFFGGARMVRAIGVTELTVWTGIETSYKLWGTKTDIDYTRKMLESMWRQALAAKKFFVDTDWELNYVKTLKGTNNSTYWNMIYQFLRGYCFGMAEKVEMAKRSVMATTGAELVLVGRKEEIVKFQESSGVGVARPRRVENGNAYLKGKAEGYRADVGNAVTK